MKNLFELIINGLLYAWRKQMSIPLSKKLYQASLERGDWGCAGFPLLGWFSGLVIVFAGVVTEWIFNVYAGALVFSVLAWLLFLFRDSGRSDNVLAALIIGKLPKDNIQLHTAVPIILLLGRMALLVLLYVNGQAWHLPLVIGGVFTLEALLTVDGDFIPPLLDDTPEAKRNMGAVAVILTFISFALLPLVTALSVAAFMVIWNLAQRSSRRYGTDLLQITMAGGVAGWVLLLAGVFAI